MKIKQTAKSKSQQKQFLEQQIIASSEARKVAGGKRMRNFVLARALRRKTKELQAKLLLLY
jgi:hypothetical protein